MNLPFNWFDIVLPIVLIFGIQRGRKHGMSQELLLVTKWVAIVIVGGLTYETLGETIEASSALSHLASYRLAYFAIALTISIAFMVLTKLAHGKLVGSDIFGSGEYYLGMMAGLVRYSCIMIFALAFLNSRLYSSAEVNEELRFQNEVYGSNFFPTGYSFQAQVFEQSFTGPLIRKGLGFLLIKSTITEDKGLKRRPSEQLPE
ncbi:MAG TPA: CvpA family protein [Verrucomicrobiae bacterium]|nr:CvpA family protein [Verrucomicrobiae bacterium]